MNTKWKSKKTLKIAAGVVAALGISIAVAVSLALPGKPTVHLEGAEFVRAADGSVQMLAAVSIENVPVSGGVVMWMECNGEYLTPSNYVTNEALVGEVANADCIYQVPEELYEGKNPFYPYTSESEVGNQYGVSVFPDLNVGGKNPQIQAVIEPKGSPDEVEKGKIHSFLNTEEYGDRYQTYVDASEKTEIAVFSFRVSEEEGKLAEMIQTFNGKEDNKKGGMFGANDDFLLRIDIEGDNFLYMLPFWDEEENYYPNQYWFDEIETVVTWDFEDMLIDAYSAKDKVVINAYEAYENGTPLDLADALLRYSPTVRGKHIADDRLEDFTIYWGGVDGCDIEVDGGHKYHLTRTYAPSGTPDGGYTVQEEIDGVWVDTDDSWYSPKGGHYIISQMFRYDIGTGEKIYPDPIRVELTVTPITVTDVTADDLSKVYQQDDAPEHYDDLKLPGTAQLVTDIVPGQVSLTIPVESWLSTKDKTQPIANDLNNLHGTAPDGVTDVVWNGLGTYDFTANPIYDEAVICRVYPWLTVKNTYTLEAVRRVQEEAPAEFEIYYGVTDDAGLLTLKVAKKVDGAYVDMMPDDTFRLKLPNGTVVDNNWFVATDGQYYWERQTGGDPAIDNKVGYTILLQAGTPTSEPQKSGHELVRRSINLGGYFQVAVTEPGQPESGFVDRYVRPRANIYTNNYYDANSFNYTGTRASLYPFYANSVLPTYVMLPAGDTVRTRYDGNTGAEPGSMNAFKVDAWTFVSTTDDGTGADTGTWDSATSSWTPAVPGQPIIIHYGKDGANHDQFAGDYNYTGFGRVTNPRSQMIQMDVQVQAPESPELPDESVMLTYEGWGDAVINTPTGEVQRVVFDVKQVGYNYRQTVTLTLTNNGTEEINDIYVDAIGEAAHANEFIITQQPAPNLPAGASTTFTVSYILDLEVGKHTAIETPIRIYSNKSSTEPLKTFETEIEITDEEVYRLYVVTDPLDGSMGTAGPVVGPVGSPATLDETAVPNTFPAGRDVWLLAKPEKDYSVLEIYYKDAVGNKIPLLLDTTTPVTNPDDVLATITMPRHDLVVYVVFEESIYSKLRLIDIQDWSGTTDSQLEHQLPLMLHEHDDSPISSADKVSYTPVRVADDYTMTATESVLIDPDTAIRLTEDEYLVVIPAEAARSQVRIVLQDKLEPEIEMIANYDIPAVIYHRNPGTMTDYTKHQSSNFNSPAPGEQLRVTIKLSHEGVERVYTLIIARRFDLKNVPLSYPMNPGNSPYGLIMWDDQITDKDTAKREYDKEDRFAAGYMPSQAQALTLTYWQQAWGGINYDRMDEALFVFVGEPFEDFGPVEGKVTNSAGDVVDNADISRTLTGLMHLRGDVSQSQKARFENAYRLTDVFDLGKADVTTIEKDFWSDYELRPGVYELQYSYIDFDGATMTFTRPLIVLNRLGDVDQSGAAEVIDAGMLEQRVNSALGYEANYTDSQLFRSRVCDVNNDRNINQIDANGIHGGAKGEFYMPTGYSK